MFIQAWVPLLAGMAAAIPVVPGGDDCQVRTGSGSPKMIINKIMKTEIVYFPVVINTFINQNTILNFIGGITINVYNAPTQILTIATGTSTTTNTAITTVLPGNINIFQTVSIIEFPVVISTFVQQNTIIQATGEVNIVINNAPTFILTTATATSTITATITSTLTTSNSLPTPFLLAPVAAGNLGRRLRRQAAQQFIAPDGRVVGQCSEAAIYTIDNGQLTSDGQLVSINRGEISAIFQTSLALGDISTTFSITDELAWSNFAFENGVARFCSTGVSTFALFTTNTTVDGCVPQSLIVIPASSCNNDVIMLSSSSSSNQSSIGLSSSSSAPSSTTTTSSPSSSSEASVTSTSDASSAIESAASSSDATTVTTPATSSWELIASTEPATSSSDFHSSTETSSTPSATFTESATPTSDFIFSTTATPSRTRSLIPAASPSPCNGPDMILVFGKVCLCWGGSGNLSLYYESDTGKLVCAPSFISLSSSLYLPSPTGLATPTPHVIFSTDTATPSSKRSLIPFY